MIDYHLHTPLCNHAVGSMDAYIRRAVDIGLKEICFLDHLTISDYEKHLTMTPNEIPLYFQAIQVQKKRYAGVIKIKSGLEIDYNPARTKLFQEIVGTYSFDLIGSSIHFLKDLNIASSKSVRRLKKMDPDYLYRIYFEKLEKMLDQNYFDVVCHLDLLKKFGLKPSKFFEKDVNKILSLIKKKNLVVEFNTSGYSYPAKEAYPSFNIIQKCHKMGIGITLGSDAHNPDSVGRRYDMAFRILYSAGYRRLTTFTKRNKNTVLIPVMA